MRYQRMARLAKQAIDKRGGVEALKQDLQQVSDVAKGKGTLKEKAKAAAEALKQPGSATKGDGPVAAPAAPAAPSAPETPIAHPAEPPADAGMAGSEPGSE
jgi:hypothetical protein